LKGVSKLLPCAVLVGFCACEPAGFNGAFEGDVLVYTVCGGILSRSPGPASWTFEERVDGTVTILDVNSCGPFTAALHEDEAELIPKQCSEAVLYNFGSFHLVEPKMEVAITWVSDECEGGIGGQLTRRPES